MVRTLGSSVKASSFGSAHESCVDCFPKIMLGSASNLEVPCEAFFLTFHGHGMDDIEHGACMKPPYSIWRFYYPCTEIVAWYFDLIKLLGSYPCMVTVAIHPTRALL